MNKKVKKVNSLEDLKDLDLDFSGDPDELVISKRELKQLPPEKTKHKEYPLTKVDCFKTEDKQQEYKTKK